MFRRLFADKPPFETSGEQHIYEKLHRELKPTKLTVKDSSGGCGSMYVVEIEAECFRGKNRVNQTKMVNGLLKEELKEMHGLRVLCSVPLE
ncbi:bola protein [Kickxella alabastrina]|uniref:bola protein n=1 Tax=Kickxella alabastrina TaxID=61397 RepID=UPI00221F138C|nr:bola protein [Kickxella alabastrina]KAI7823922.1 bola protein [Kickxella alabastrina]